MSLIKRLYVILITNNLTVDYYLKHLVTDLKRKSLKELCLQIKPIVAIVGRPNVGKSTLFNAIARRRKAVIDDMPGVTRDRNYADVDRDGNAFILVDTGGFDSWFRHGYGKINQGTGPAGD